MNEEALERDISSIPYLAKLTPDTVSAALTGFMLPLPDLEWLTAATRGALFVARQSEEETTERQSNTATRDELYRIAGRLAVLWDQLGEPHVDSAILDYSHRGGEPFGEAPDYLRLKEAEAQIEWLGVFLRRAGMMLDVQRRGWRLRAEREAHILRARVLANVFREAFEVEPAAHSRPTKSPLPWPDFYQRIMGAAFGKAGVNDLIPMLAEALALDAADPLIIAGKFWPDKPCD